jgi:thiol-disulfide isomerase/thioredoxin
MSGEWITSPKLFGRASNRWAGGLILLIVCVAVVSALLQGREQRAYHSSLVLGDPLPNYSAVSLDGNPVSIRDHEGTVVLLNFWATWCSSCVDQFPGMQLLKHEFRGQGLEIISVNIDREDRAGVQEFWNDRGYDWLNLFDEQSRVEKVFGWGDRYPKTVVVNRDGTVGVWWQGRLDLALPENRKLIEEAISGHVVWDPGS